MPFSTRVLAFAVGVSLSFVPSARAQGQSSDPHWVFDLAIGVNPSISGNINSGVIGTLQGQTAAFLPHSYGDVYGTGFEFRFGGGYALNSVSEVRGTFIWQSVAADLVRLGDLGPSSLYGQFSDYKTFGLEFGYRRYVPLTSSGTRVYAEANLGIADVQRINVQLAAPQSNIIFDNTDFYDGTAAFTWSIAAGVLFPIAKQVDFSAQLGLRHVSGLADVDQLVGTGLAAINNDSGRLTFPIVIGVQYRFK